MRYPMKIAIRIAFLLALCAAAQRSYGLSVGLRLAMWNTSAHGEGGEHPAENVSVDVGGKQVTVPVSWLAEHSVVVESSGGDAVTALNSTAANGRLKVLDCYILGLDPEDKTNDFRIASISIGADGMLDISKIEFDPPQWKWNVTSVVPILKGSATLDGKSDWMPVTDENKSAFRFFKVEVMPQ